MSYYETNLPIKISLPQGVVAPDNGIPAYNFNLLLTAAQIEQVKTALEHGQRLIQTRLARTKKSKNRFEATIEQNTVNSALDKAKRCKPVQRYSLEVLSVEVEAIIYCLEHSKNSKRKDVQQLIAILSEALECED